jgi:hypothetical protein
MYYTLQFCFVAIVICILPSFPIALGDRNASDILTRRSLARQHRTIHGDLKDWSHLNSKNDCNNQSYPALKERFLAFGYVVFRSCSLNMGVVDQANNFVTKSKSNRIQDAWEKEDSVRDIAADPDTIQFLGYLHGRQAFPFQTLNFPVATQQRVHSDVIHFDTLPTRGLMTASWVALEDIHPDSGPLIYYPSSHSLGLWDMDELGIGLDTMSTKSGGPGVSDVYLLKLQETIDRLGLKPAYGTIKKGESFVWAASLLHGGSKLNDVKRTRKSQVTHYFLTGAKQYWVPRTSNTAVDQIYYRKDIPACAPTKHNLVDCGQLLLDRFVQRRKMQKG